MINFNSFIKKKCYEGQIVDLKEKYHISSSLSFDGVETIYFDIYKHDNKEKIGTIELRMNIDGDNYYYGNVGYYILEKHRGHNYAYEGCKLLFELAKEIYKFDELYITCSPDNIASYKTLVKLNGELLETIDVPKYHSLYLNGETVKCIFKYKL